MSSNRDLLHGLFYFFLRPFGTAFSNRKFPARLLLKHVILQKILRINSHVPWPVHPTSQVQGVANIIRGTRCPGLSVGCYLDGRNGIHIGENVWIGPNVSIISMNHEMTDFNKYVRENPIVIGDDCWLGARCVILPGVKLGRHVVVGAGAVVTRSFEENDILLTGVPAKITKKIPPYTGTNE
jgi:acetyltransferase-like isoleucine patch superfamily enzyme